MMLADASLLDDATIAVIPALRGPEREGLLAVLAACHDEPTASDAHEAACRIELARWRIRYGAFRSLDKLLLAVEASLELSARGPAADRVNTVLFTLELALNFAYKTRPSSQ